MKCVFWFALGALNAVGIVLNLFGIGYGDIKIILLQILSVILCLNYGFSEVMKNENTSKKNRLSVAVADSAAELPEYIEQLKNLSKF